MKGTIKTLLKDKRCGFIRGEDKTEYFFHASALRNTEFDDLSLNDAVTFEETEGLKGPRAEEVYV